MRQVITITSTILVSVLFLSFVDTKIVSKDLFDLFKDKEYSEEGLNKVLNYNPDNDILFIPELDLSNNIFDSIEDLSICRMPEVLKFVYLYLTTGREYTIKSIKRSQLYIDIIKTQMRQYPDIPEDIALLPLLESGFNPYAVSRSKAVGLWQFIPKTAKMLGLKINKYVDERRDIIKSTHAAMRHLNNLYNQFNSWELALLAYNGGGNYIFKKMKKYDKYHFYELTKVLNKETSEYLYRYAALLLIYKYPELFSIEDELGSIDIDNNVDIVEFKYPVNIKKLVQLCDIQEKILYIYNPQLKRNITPIYEKNYKLILPESIIDRIEKNKKIKSKITIKFRYLKSYKIKKGDTLLKISKKFRTRMKKIIIVNNIRDPDKIKIGDFLYIPIS